MPNRRLKIGLIVVGIIVLVVFLGADVLRIGQYPAAIGWVQWTGAVVGVILIAVGAFLGRSSAE